MKNFPKATFGLKENVASALCYPFGWITGIIFLLCENENKTVRFHALQSTVFFGCYSVINIVLDILGKIPLLGFFADFIQGVLGVVALVAFILLIVKAAKGELYKVPIVGDVVYDKIFNETK